MTDSSLPTDDIDALAADIATADHVVALTGAGVSTASGLPSFRGEDGIWGNEFDPADFQYTRFQSDPGEFWRDRIDLHDRMYGDDIEPNAAHDALADLQARGTLDGLITQNVDGLHEAAGSEAVLELHGNAQRAVCDTCGRRLEAGPVYERARDGELPPRCADCDGPLKPDVVLFGQPMPDGPLQQAQHHARDADVFLAVGSSLTVEPAASLPRVAASRGATVGIVNLDETGLSKNADYDIRADVTTALPAIETRVRRHSE
ncbi:SIR2 family NAD-dependent protein deacylase [Salinibaculum rarum]|uniref:SIR2 family NAD-dependent protein deacylase n=1 Tax=Salinibaculum rarum TaxID=3058903 RepID=UPI00265D62C2|nr:Sir2 family NAD-dependent protein deacetylase [Salinibaculum sp. KK48]